MVVRPPSRQGHRRSPGRIGRLREASLPEESIYHPHASLRYELIGEENSDQTLYDFVQEERPQRSQRTYSDILLRVRVPHSVDDFNIMINPENPLWLQHLHGKVRQMMHEDQLEEASKEFLLRANNGMALRELAPLQLYAVEYIEADAEGRGDIPRNEIVDTALGALAHDLPDVAEYLEEIYGKENSKDIAKNLKGIATRVNRFLEQFRTHHRATEIVNKTWHSDTNPLVVSISGGESDDPPPKLPPLIPLGEPPPLIPLEELEQRLPTLIPLKLELPDVEIDWSEEEENECVGDELPPLPELIPIKRLQQEGGPAGLQKVKPGLIPIGAEACMSPPETDAWEDLIDQYRQEVPISAEKPYSVIFCVEDEAKIAEAKKRVDENPKKFVQIIMGALISDRSKPYQPPKTMSRLVMNDGSWYVVAPTAIEGEYLGTLLNAEADACGKQGTMRVVEPNHENELRFLILKNK